MADMAEDAKEDFVTAEEIEQSEGSESETTVEAEAETASESEAKTEPRPKPRPRENMLPSRRIPIPWKGTFRNRHRQ